MSPHAEDPMTQIDQTESVEQQKRPTYPFLLSSLAHPDDVFEVRTLRYASPRIHQQYSTPQRSSI